MSLFDTLKASQRLQEAGFDEEKAGAIVSAFAEDFGARLASKVDLQQFEARMAERFEHQEERMAERFDHQEGRTDDRFELMEQRLTNRFGLFATAATGVLLTAIGIATGVIVAL